MAGGLVYLGYQNYQLQQRLNQLQEQRANQNQPEPGQVSPFPSPSNEEISEWKAFSDKELGFSINIPQSWNVREVTPNLQIEMGPLANNAIDPVVYGYTNSLAGSRLTAEELRAGGFVVDESMVTIDGKIVSRKKVTITPNVISPESYDAYMDEAIIPMPNEMETQLRITDSKYESIFTNILSTFKFLE